MLAFGLAIVRRSHSRYPAVCKYSCSAFRMSSEVDTP